DQVPPRRLLQSLLRWRLRPAIPRGRKGALRMTVDLGRLVSHLNGYLRVEAYPEAAINGLQVAGRKKIAKVAFAVDGVYETFARTAAAGADLLIVHHGIFWGFQYALRGPDYKRIKLLMDHEIGLYAAHLPLDAHAEVGH